MRTESAFVVPDTDIDNLVRKVQPTVSEFFQNYFWGMDNYEGMSVIVDARMPLTKKEAAIFFLFEDGDVDVEDMLNVNILIKGLVQKLLLPTGIYVIMRNEDFYELYAEDIAAEQRFMD